MSSKHTNRLPGKEAMRFGQKVLRTAKNLPQPALAKRLGVKGVVQVEAPNG
jgi:hypothetical protein